MDYGAIGFRTRRGVYWMAVALAVLMLSVTVAQYAFRPDLSAPRLVGQLLWVVMVFVVTSRLLEGLEQLEQGRSEPTEGMKRVFDTAGFLPVLGYLPILVWC